MRPASDADQPFLRQLYASTRTEELAPLGWDRATLETFLDGQFQAQRRHFDVAFAGADHQIVTVGTAPVGRLVVARSSTELRVVDISMLPPYRGRGIGSAIMTGLLAQARAQPARLSLHVERNNRALGWYLRLGFIVVEDRGSHFYLSA